MNLQVGELVVLNGGPGDQWWVAKVLQLCDVVYDAQNPDLHDGDIQVQQYTGSGRSAVFTPTKGNKQMTWAQCVDQWGSEFDILDHNGKLRTNVRSRLGKT